MFDHHLNGGIDKLLVDIAAFFASGAAWAAGAVCVDHAMEYGKKSSLIK
jgi:hypothetical protein